MRRTLKMTFEEALARLPIVLKAEGFGVLTEIDVTATFKAKLGVDFRKCHILGACNPPFAYKAMQAHIEVTQLVPCNVAIFENDQGATEVQVADPIQLFGLMEVGGKEMAEMAQDVHDRLQRALDQA